MLPLLIIGVGTIVLGIGAIYAALECSRMQRERDEAINAQPDPEVRRALREMERMVCH